jgi:magnesium transporter
MTLVDNAVYVDGRRSADPVSLEETYEVLRARHGMAWIGLYRPSLAEIHSLASEFNLHPLVVEDAVKAHQRAKLERYDNVLFTVLRPARHLDESEQVEFGELHVFTGLDFVVTIRHAESPDLHLVRARLEGSRSCSGAVQKRCSTRSSTRLWTNTPPVVAGLENDIDEIED